MEKKAWKCKVHNNYQVVKMKLDWYLLWKFQITSKIKGICWKNTPNRTSNHSNNDILDKMK